MVAVEVRFNMELSKILVTSKMGIRLEISELDIDDFLSDFPALMKRLTFLEKSLGSNIAFVERKGYSQPR